MKLTTLSTLGADASGVSLVEVLVALVIFSMAILGLTSAGMVAGKQLQMSRTDMGVWTAVHYQMDKVTALGYDSLTAGAGTVQGHAMSWDLQGVSPKKLILVVDAENSQGVMVPDTFITYMADWTP